MNSRGGTVEGEKEIKSKWLYRKKGEDEEEQSVRRRRRGRRREKEGEVVT